KVDSRADIYSLGCTMFFLLTGRPPFSTGTMAQRLMMHQMQNPPRIKDFRPDCPDELQVICDQMMAKSPEARPSASRVRQMLAMFVARHSDPRLARPTRKADEPSAEMAPPDHPSSLSIDGPKRFPLPPKLP
ncbi:MAG TPA: protein kinase, partial [Pirellulales bacterium]